MSNIHCILPLADHVKAVRTLRSYLSTTWRIDPRTVGLKASGDVVFDNLEDEKTIRMAIELADDGFLKTSKGKLLLTLK